MIQNKVNHKIPFEIFEKWFGEASINSKIIEPSAMCLATSTLDNKPSARMVLLKKFDERGFCFYTNLTSRKGRELKQNLNVALCFYWGILGRQVRIEGEIEPVSIDEADEYFASRRRESKIGAWASKQSQKMENWQEFENENGHLCCHPKVEKKFAKSPRQSKSFTERGGMPNFSVF